MPQQTRPTEFTDLRSSEVRREVQVESESVQKRKLDLSLPKILAGALAAASAAVASSWLGVAGTVLGAVIVSIVVSVTTALYSRPLEHSSKVIREVLPLPYPYRDDAGMTETRVLDASSVQTEQTASTGDGLVAVETEIATTEVERRRPISWKAIAASSAAMLVLGFGMLTAVEALTGGAVGASGGGTTLSRIVKGDSSHSGGNSDSDKPQQQSPTSDGPDNPTPTTDQPTEAPTTDAPTTDEPTDPEPTEPEPTEPTPTQAQPTDGFSTDGADAGSADSGSQ